MSLPPQTLRRLIREITQLQSSPPPGIRILFSADSSNIAEDIIGVIQGPEGTPYAGGFFKVGFRFGGEFPGVPPKCTMLTKIFHPNIAPSTGEICVNTLKRDWQPTHTIQHILITIRCLLIHPNPDSALDEEAGRLLVEDWQRFCERAKMVTSVHARRQPEGISFEDDEKEEAEADKEKEPPASASKKPSSTLGASKDLTNTRKSPAPSPSTKDTSTPTTTATTKERHTSPTPLSTADANVPLAGLTTTTTTAAGGVVKGTTTTSTGTKRAATGNAGNAGAEKRKKALKRL